MAEMAVATHATPCLRACHWETPESVHEFRISKPKFHFLIKNGVTAICCASSPLLKVSFGARLKIPRRGGLYRMVLAPEAELEVTKLPTPISRTHQIFVCPKCPKPCLRHIVLAFIEMALQKNGDIPYYLSHKHDALAFVEMAVIVLHIVVM
jgi:hypothetical protein